MRVVLAKQRSSWDSAAEVHTILVDDRVETSQADLLTLRPASEKCQMIFKITGTCMIEETGDHAVVP